MYGRPHLKVMPSLLATGDMGVGLNANDYYRSVNVCEACFHKYENIDQFRERVHYMLMEDIQRENDRKAKEDEAKARHLRDKTAKHCILNAWCVLGIGHSGACSDKEASYVCSCGCASPPDVCTAGRCQQGTHRHV